jgi:hypothetical protein
MNKGPINLTENKLEATKEFAVTLAQTKYVRLERLFDKKEDKKYVEAILSRRFWD